MPNEALILIVDDQEANRKLLKGFVLGLACRPLVANDGPAALDAIARERPDLVLLDIMMPGMDGVEVLRRLRAADETRLLPVVMISALDEVNQVAECIELGADDYLVKPFNPILLRARIASCLERKRLLDREAEYQALLGRYNDDLEAHVQAQLTEIQETQRQLVQAQKMESVGALAAGISHDFNNILQSLIGYTSLALHRVDPDSKVEGYLLEVEKASERAAKLTGQLLNMSRRGEGALQAVNLNWIIQDVANFLRSSLPPGITLDVQKGADIAPVRADANQIQQVLMNLCVNARDAIGETGTVRISTANVELTAEACALLPPLMPGPHVQLTVTDTGHGMDAATQAKIFEPFFTTKPEGKGTGLGMSIVYGIVQKHGGALRVESAPGKGTTFRIVLPAVDEAPVVLDPEAEVAGGTERILLVDDDPLVRAVARQMLQDSGYDCRAAEHGRAALKVCEKRAGQIDVLITDLLMPEMGGRELCRTVHGRWPDIKIVMTSGFPLEEGQTLFAREGVQAFLPKPYTRAELGRTVRAVLDGEAPA